MYPDYWYDQNYMTYCLREAEKMYPEIYHQIYRHIRVICEREDNEYNNLMYPFPRKEIVDKMVEEVYENIQKEHMYRSPDGFFDSGGILRAFIGALLLRELIDRRRFFPRRRRRPWFF